MRRADGLVLQRSHSDIILSGPESPVFIDKVKKRPWPWARLAFQVTLKSLPFWPWEAEQPEWSPDVAKCQQCAKGFDFLNRRHHCRRCGRCLCSDCTSRKRHLLRMRYLDTVRQCSTCANIRYQYIYTNWWIMQQSSYIYKFFESVWNQISKLKNYCRILLRILYLFIPKFESDFILRIFFSF